MTPEAILAKNSLDDGGLWVTTLYMTSPTSGLELHMTNNTSDIVVSDQTYVAFPFKMGELKEGIKGELPTLSIHVSNVTRTTQGYIEADQNFGSNWEVRLDFYYIPETELPADDKEPIVTTRTPELSLDFISQSVSCDANWCTVTLGVENPIRQQFPYRKQIPSQCQAVFKDAATGCPYTGADETCDKTLSDCRSKFTGDIPFVGFPEIPTGHGIFKV